MESTDNKGYSFEIQEEIFELVLHVDNSRVSAHDLRRLLFHSEKLVKSINKTLRKEYPEYQLGFDIVDLNVLALEKGSFSLKFSISEKNRKKIKKLTHNPTFATIIGVVITGLFSAKPEITVKQIDNSTKETVNVVINNNIILNNPTTRNAVDSIADLVIDSDTINGFSIRYMGENHMEEVPISKTQLKETCHRRHNIETIIEFLSRNDYYWTFRYHGSIIKARVDDPIFLDKVHSGKKDLQKGDFLLVELTSFTHGRCYIIEHVIEHFSE